MSKALKEKYKKVLNTKIKPLRKWFKKISKTIFIVLFILLIFIMVPISTAILTNISGAWKINIDNDWIGFFASYLGSIIGVLGVFGVMKIDQLKREQEKKDELFLKNIDIYKKIVDFVDNISNNEAVLNYEQFYEEVIKEPKWVYVDNSTKNVLNSFLSRARYSDDNIGVSNAVKIYVMRYLSLVFYMETNEHDKNSDDSSSIQPNYDAITEAIIKSSLLVPSPGKTEIIFKEDNIRKEFEKDASLECYVGVVNNIFSKLQKIDDSDEWKQYETARTNFIKDMSKLRVNIERRIEKVLDY